MGREQLWIAPRIGPGESLSELLLEFADTVLVDAFHEDKFGGTGATSDWVQFAELRKRWAATNWVLAGGLKLANVTEALAVTGAERIDVNSGVESAPGHKSAKKLRELFGILKPE